MMSRATILSCSLGVVGVLACAQLARAKAQAPTVFERIHLAEHKRHDSAAKAKALQEKATANDAKIEDAKRARALIERTSKALKRQSYERQMAWSNAQRKLQRQAMLLEPGQANDLTKLLALAEPHAHKKAAQDYAVLEDYHTQSERVLELVHRQSALLVELAQHSADAQTAQAEQATAKDQAKRADAQTISRDLEITSEKLAANLSLILKNPSKEDFHRLKGALIPPVRTKPAHGYGPRRQGQTTSYVRHSGYTYDVAAGTQVRAIGPGLVVYAGWFEGYGQVVILDHGVGYHSVYAHLSKLSVEVSAPIKRGDQLGLSGASGSLEGDKLYFEMRKDGSPINPGDWFIR